MFLSVSMFMVYMDFVVIVLDLIFVASSIFLFYRTMSVRRTGIARICRETGLVLCYKYGEQEETETGLTLGPHSLGGARAQPRGMRPCGLGLSPTSLFS